MLAQFIKFNFSILFFMKLQLYKFNYKPKYKLKNKFLKIINKFKMKVEYIKKMTDNIYIIFTYKIL